MGTSLARSRAPLVFVFVSLALALAGCGDLPEPASCSASDPCHSGAWCRTGRCVANAAPVAVIELPSPAGSNRPLLFRGAGSRDDDPGDSISAWSWKAAPPPGSTGCEPFPGTGAGSDFTVVFPCAGEHEISLTVVDSMGLESAARTLRLLVEPTLDPPVVAAGADVSIGHRCGAAPVSCSTWDGTSPEVTLSASATGPAGVTFTYVWTAELPPELAQQPAPRITFSPGETVSEPVVRIETEGTAIAGRYTFVVAATDSRGMIAVGRQLVDVGNRPPAVSGGGRVLLPHGYDPVSARFVAIGETPAAAWSDPDGDPVTPLGFTSTWSGDGGSVFDVQGFGDHARLTVVVPYSKPADAAFLIGPGVARRVELVVSDANGARASAGWDVEVTNRPPRLVAPVAAASVDHTYEASFQRYAAQAALSTWVDDDGDPLLLTVGGDPECTDVVGRQGTAWVTCSAPFTGRPDPGRLVGVHALAVSAADPFQAGPAQETRLEVRNRPPRLAVPLVTMEMPCLDDRTTCCRTDVGKPTCSEYDFHFLETSAMTSIVVDDDGDPLDLSAAATGGCLSASTVALPCAGAGCSPVLTMCGDRWACAWWLPVGELSVAAGDGLSSVAGTISVEGICRP